MIFYFLHILNFLHFFTCCTFCMFFSNLYFLYFCIFVFFYLCTFLYFLYFFWSVLFWSGLRHVVSCLDNLCVRPTDQQTNHTNNHQNIEPSRFLLLYWKVKENLEISKKLQIIEKNKYQKTSRGMQILAIRSLTRHLWSTGKQVFCHSTPTHKNNSQTL